MAGGSSEAVTTMTTKAKEYKTITARKNKMSLFGFNILHPVY
jgi:hypothetical protein